MIVLRHCVLGALALAGCHSTASTEHEPAMLPAMVHCEPLTRARVEDLRTLRGNVVPQPDHDATVSPQVSGRILRVLVREGDEVRADAVIAEIESQPLHDALTQARAQLTTARAQEHNASVGLTRSQRLFDRGIAARQEVDDATARLGESGAAVSAARAAVDVATRNVARASVRAPIAGTVVRVLRRAGELVDGTPATPVLEIADPSALEFLATAAPLDLVALQRDQPATLRFDALRELTFAASVRAIAPAIDAASGLGSVRLALAPSNRRPPLGLYGTAAVAVGAHDAVLAPAGALRGASGATEVVVCDGANARVRVVEVGQRTGDRAEITRGLTGMEQVATGSTVLGLVDGAAIVTSR